MTRAYGLGIESMLPLPELVQGNNPIDVRVRVDDLLCSDRENRSTSWFGITEHEGYLHWNDVGTFRVSNGSEIAVDPSPAVHQSELRLFLLGPALALLLHQRGLLVLHASAVSVDGHAVAFMGAGGWGKSTLAGALYARGHNLVADDIVAIDVDSAAIPAVSPGFPQLKLWPDAVSEIGEAPQRLRRLHHRYEKRAYPATRGFSTLPQPLRCIYVLAEGAELRVDALAPQTAFAELIRHTYTTPVLEASPDSCHFRHCAKVASHVPIRRLHMPRKLAAVSETAALVEKDVEQMFA